LFTYIILCNTDANVTCLWKTAWLDILVNWWGFTWRTILPNFIPIQLVKTALGFFEEHCPNRRTRRTTRWV